MTRTRLRKYAISIRFDKPIDLQSDDFNTLRTTGSFKTIQSAFNFAMQTAKIFERITKAEKITITYNTTSGTKMQTWFIAPEKEEPTNAAHLME